ncbi:hypothetical protein QJS10_CPB13g01583 [Acorus calamus]|uniref:Uncharacterized protein n=2 Tax=Acorus calamus TaxID=4465 RepID=A0AAV9DJ01_ACOCL|nr:hypothetical protein QJS10_CPB13g01583 [Acorus calamus]
MALMTTSSLLLHRPIVPTNPNPRWTALQQKLRSGSRGRHSCLFSSGNRKQEEAKKALESALGGKKSEFEKWNKEIQKREEVGGGNASGNGGWFGGGGGWFGGFFGDRFWEEAQQACLTMLGITFLLLLLAKGNVMFAVVFNSLLFALRGWRNWFTLVSTTISGRTSPSMSELEQSRKESNQIRSSAKESVVRKWGMD